MKYLVIFKQILGDVGRENNEKWGLNNTVSHVSFNHLDYVCIHMHPGSSIENSLQMTLITLVRCSVLREK